MSENLPEVNSIAQKRAENAEQNQPGHKWKFPEVCQALALCINADIADVLCDRTGQKVQFPRRFTPVKAGRNGVVTMEVLPGKVLRPVSDDEVIRTIAEFCGSVLLGLPQFNLLDEQLHKAFKYWFRYTSPIDAPKPAAFASDDSYCLHRLPFDPSPGATPHWDEMFDRITNADPLRAWIGSLFDPQADKQQYVWLYGEGRNGKGSLTRALRRVIGDSATATINEVPKIRNSFWTDGFVHARLVFFPDCEQPGFPSSGLFKSLTGGDPIRVERKYGLPYDVIPECKFFFTSNKVALVSRERSDLRRAIYCEVANPKTIFENYEERLWDEMPHFIHQCREAYARLCPNGGEIEACHDHLVERIDEHNADLELFFDLHFALEPNASVSYLAMNERLETKWPHDTFQWAKFRRWVLSKYADDLKEQAVWDGARKKTMKGIKGLKRVGTIRDPHT
jgi:hypothetical protein